MTFMRQAIYILVLLALSNASLNNKYALNYGSSRSIMSVMMEVENNLKLNGPLETVHGVLNNFKNAVGQEQIQHDEINQLQKSECDSEIDYRGIEVRDAQRSLETANGLLKTANKLVLKASSTLAETQNIITQTQQHINIINDVRKEDTQSYNRIVVSFNDALNTIDDALDLTGEIANGHIQLSQVAQITSQMLRHAIKLQKTQQFAPVMKSLAQFGETQEYERLNELLTTLRKHIEEAFSEFSNKNQVALYYIRVFNVGGRTGNVGEQLTIDVYDTETSEWSKFNSVQRFRHSSWLVDSSIYVYGGFELDSPNIPTDIISKINLQKLFQPNDTLHNKFMGTLNSTKSISPPNATTPILSPHASDGPASLNSSLIQKPQGKGPQQPRQFARVEQPQAQFKFVNQAVMADDKKEDPRFKKPKVAQENSVSNFFISTLLQPKSFINLSENAKFLFKHDHICQLCDQAEEVIKQQPMVLRCKAPIKIFGDIHGQYSDLMRFFDLWGSPWLDGKDGDIEAFDYLFLGDFVDRGNHSLETICLLLALKIKYPEQIHLIRGNHEDKWINNGFGFSEECAQRLGEDPNDDDSVFARVNRLFEWLPLAALVEDKIICLHGGIGSQLNYVAEIEQLQRPLEVIHEVSTPEQQLVVDILWSDPTDSDQEFGIQPNIIRDPAGTGNIVKFGPDRVINFLIKNNLSMIIRAHECVMDGFERFAGGQLLTIFSATDYCGRHKNAGAVLILKRNFEIVPKLIYPQNLNAHNWIEDDEALKKRPPTPPRWKNQAQRKSYDA